MSISVSITRTGEALELPLPAYQTSGSAGMDLYAAVAEPLILAAGERVSVPTGIAISLPEGCEAQVRGRSGLARKFGISLANGIGTIDADYRGEIQVLLVNLGPEPFEIKRGDRIAQLVVAPVLHVEWCELDTLDETARGISGFGHTGHTHLQKQ